MSSPAETGMVLVKKLASNAIIPLKSSKYAAGYDLFAPETFKLEPGEPSLILLNLAFEMPINCYGRIAEKSLLSVRSITVHAGVIDADFKGNVGILLSNWGPNSLLIKARTPIAQIIFEQILHPRLIETDSLKKSKRNKKGWGISTYNLINSKKPKLELSNEIIVISDESCDSSDDEMISDVSSNKNLSEENFDKITLFLQLH